jgi:hypothetical protein
VIVVRYADDTIVGFEHEHEAQAFLHDVQERRVRPRPAPGENPADPLPFSTCCTLLGRMAAEEGVIGAKISTDDLSVRRAERQGQPARASSLKVFLGHYLGEAGGRTLLKSFSSPSRR